MSLKVAAASPPLEFIIVLQELTFCGAAKAGCLSIRLFNAASQGSVRSNTYPPGITTDESYEGRVTQEEVWLFEENKKTNARRGKERRLEKSLIC